MFIAIALITIGFIGFLAFRDWMQYHRLSTKDVDKLLMRVSKLIILEEWQQAKKEITPLLVHNLGGKETLLLYSQVLRGTKAYEKALDTIKLGLKTYPTELFFRIEEGKTLLEIGQTKGALEALKSVEGILRNESDLLDLSIAYLRTGCADNAWKIIEKLLVKNESGIVLATAGECQLELKNYPLALDYFEKSLQKGWNNHHLQTQLGNAHRLLGNFKMAEHVYRKILEKDSADIVATLGLGACMQERGFYQKALLVYQSGAAWEKKDPRILFQAGLMALYSHRYGFAEEYFSKTIDLLGPTAELLSYQGYAFEQQEKWKEAEAIYCKQAELFPKDVRPYRALAWLFGVGLSTTLTQEEGLFLANKALELSEDTLSYEILSACEARIGNYEAAYRIQEYLSTKDESQAEKNRRQNLLKTLRKNLPLDNQHILRRMVA